MGTKQNMQDIFEQFASRTSMHGMSSLASARSFRSQLLWSCVCVSSMLMFFFMLISLVRDHLSFNVTVKVQEVITHCLPIYPYLSPAHRDPPEPGTE